ncbi:MAG: recombination protein O N-terminal domain-containing protein [Bacteroidales bacterium]|nr:recombination protein O N-terminal domain-containing protein [Bacteroidales bacterium]
MIGERSRGFRVGSLHNMFQTTKGLILREVRYKEADRMLTILTESEGKITAKARGALRKSSRTGAATQQLTWSELTLFGNRLVLSCLPRPLGLSLNCARDLLSIRWIDKTRSKKLRDARLFWFRVLLFLYPPKNNCNNCNNCNKIVFHS